MAKHSKFTKFISVLLTITFLASQAYADPRPSPATKDDLAPSVISDPNINPQRSDAARGDIAKGTEPGAIGNGRPLVELMQGILPDIAVAENADARIAKVKDAISYALTRATQNSSYVPDQYKVRVEDAIKTLKDMLDRPADLAKIHFFNARVVGDEDYLLGFNREGKVGIAVELIDSLPLNLLAQYIFHEVIPEKGLITERQDHRNIYQDVQTAIFGLNDVLDLKKALRALINEKLGQTEVEWPNPANLPPEKRVLMLISGGEAAGINNYFSLMAKKLAAKGYSLELVKFGLDGLVRAPAEFDGVRVWVDWKKANTIKDMPGAAEGTARVKLNDPKHPEYMQNALTNLKSYCKTLVMIGGNDHLGEAGKIAKRLKDEGIDMVVIALPKTIDRDTKVYPIGAVSAGRHAQDYVLRAAPLPGSNKCVIVEIMGRDMGWLTVRAGDMRPSEMAGYSDAQKAKMELARPTMVTLVPEFQVSLNDVVEAVNARMKKYGAAAVLVSEGFRISPNDPMLKAILEHNPLLKIRYSQVKTDVQGNLLLNELGISDFIAEALLMNSDPERSYGINREVFGYALRARVPDQVDIVVAENATTEAARLVTDESQRQAVLAQGGVCVFADIKLREAAAASMKIKPVTSTEVQGKVDIKDSGLYETSELISLGVLGVEGPKNELAELPSVSVDEPTGKNIALAIRSVNSMAESARDMSRVNLCVFPGDEGDSLVNAVNPANRKPISRDDAYVVERTLRASLYITSDTNLRLEDVVRQAYDIYTTQKFLSLVVAGNFPVNEKDPLMAELKNDESAQALINSATTDGKGNLIFGRKIVDLLAIALGNEKIVRAAGVEPKKIMSGIRKNVMGESLNLLPGEEPAGPALPKALAAEIVTEEIAKATAPISTHLTLNAKGELDMGGIVIVMKKDLPESLAGKKEGMADGAVKQEYKVMKQHLRKLFAKGVFEVEKAEDLVPQMNTLISQGLKVIVLDDGTLTKGLDPAAILGKAVENYCVIAADKVKNEENLILPFINLNAMAMVGVGVLYRDPNLIGMAYKAFTGNEPPMDLVNDLMNKAVWIIKMLPRIVKFKDELRMQEQLRKMVAASA